MNVNGLPNMRSKTYVGVYDSDVAAAYPNGEDITNASKQTTVAEIVRIRGVDDHTQRAAGLNLTGGSNNAIELCCSIMKAPTYSALAKGFAEHLSNAS